MPQVYYPSGGDPELITIFGIILTDGNSTVRSYSKLRAT